MSLFLQQPDFTVDRIRQYLRKFGEIVSIELEVNNELGAYVTFANDRVAYLVKLQYVYDNEHTKDCDKAFPFEIEVASTWLQPSYRSPRQTDTDPNASEHNESMADIFKLNEHCLLHLFKFLDLDSMVNMADVCKLFHNLLHRYCFPRCTQYEIKTGSTLLANARRTLKCIGPHIVDLKLDNCYVEPYLCSQFLNLLVEYIGSNVRRAQFINCYLDFDNKMKMMSPIFKHLEFLSIEERDENSNIDHDFVALCPNVIEFHLKMKSRLQLCRKPWPSLQRLKLIEIELLRTLNFVSLIHENPQLTELEWHAFEYNVQIPAIADHLPMLQKLTLRATDSTLAGWNLVSLIKLQHLTEIELQSLDEEHLRWCIDCLATFKGLRKISLETDNEIAVGEEDDEEQDYERSIIDLAKQLPDLQELSIKCIAITHANLVEFSRHAQRLEVLHVHWAKLNICNALIFDMVNAIKFYRPKSNQLVKMFVNPSDIVQLSARRNENVKPYISLSAKCQHFGF